MKTTYKVPVDIYVTVDGRRCRESQTEAGNVAYDALKGLLNDKYIDEYFVKDAEFVEESVF